MNVGQRIREAREDLGMPQTVLARRVGVARNTIGRYESGEHEPSFAMLEKIARELRTEPAEFLREPGPDEVITFDEEAVRAAITAARSGKLTTKEAAQAIADSVRGGPGDALEDALELLLEHAERGRSEDHAWAE